MGFGTELLAIVVLGMLLLGPKRMAAIFGHIARAKAQLEHATGNLNAQLNAEVGPTSGSGSDTSHPTALGEQ